MNLGKSDSTQTQDEIIDLRQYFSVLMRAKWKIFSFSFFTTLLIAIFVIGMTPIYQATSSLLLDVEPTNTVSIDTVYSLDTSRKEYFLTQYEIIKSRAITEQVIEELNLGNHPEFQPKKDQGLITQIKTYVKGLLPLPEQSTVVIDEEIAKRRAYVALVNAVQGRLSVTPVRNTQLVKISFQASDPRLAASVANAIGEAYIEQGMSNQLDTTRNASGWVKSRLDELRVNLDDSVDKLQAYRVKENLIDIESRGVRSIASDELESLTQSYLAARQKRYEAETISLFVSKLDSNDVDSLLSIPEISNHPSISSIKNVEIEAEKRVSELSFRYGEKHPKLIAAKAELASVQKNLNAQVNKLVRGIQKELSAAKDNERRLSQALEKEKGKYQNITNQEQGYLKLSREVDANRKLYDSFLERFKEMDITADLEVAKAHVVDRAEVPTVPVKPKKSLIILLGFVASFGFAVVLTFVLDALNDSFRSAAAVESKLGIRLLGLLPLIQLKKKEKFPLHAFFNEEYRQFAEAIRTVRTGFVLSHIDNDHKVLVVTSSIPDEGKTTTSVNIAFSMAQMEKTLLIEGDMRRPSFTKVFSLPPYQNGLSNVISGTSSLADAIVHDDVSGLDILPAGLIPPNPLEILASKKFDNLLDSLKKHYDRIIIDSAPTLAVSDAMVLSQHADSVIYVVRSDSTKQAIAKTGIDRLLEIEAKIDGIVLNRVDLAKANKHGYYPGYYDSYGYTHDNKS
ncbi:GumC family protein [Psychromonas sp. PT13]|uniref:GumC family protein n=1 Tax=Psychromonas sp. PT13 TaxID=3439547 RepID=UPI003EBCFD14